MSKGDWHVTYRALPLHLPEPAQAWEDESRLSHQAVHELKMLTTMLLKLTETLGSLGRVAVDHVSRANSSYGMRTRTRRPMHSRGSPSREPSRAPDRKREKNLFRLGIRVAFGLTPLITRQVGSCGDMDHGPRPHSRPRLPNVSVNFSNIVIDIFSSCSIKHAPPGSNDSHLPRPGLAQGGEAALRRSPKP